jgi:hypothetical protein
MAWKQLQSCSLLYIMPSSHREPFHLRWQRQLSALPLAAGRQAPAEIIMTDVQLHKARAFLNLSRAALQPVAAHIEQQQRTACKDKQKHTSAAECYPVVGRQKKRRLTALLQ